MEKHEAVRAFRSLEKELSEPDPDLESVLFQIFKMCEARGISFTFTHSPRGVYTARASLFRIGTFTSIEDALKATVAFFVTGVRV